MNQKAATYNRMQGLDCLCPIMQADFLRMPIPDASYEAVFAIESLPHAPDKRRAYCEIFRVLKPGGLFVLHKWCLTSRYDPENPQHLRLKFGIEIGNGLPDLASVPEVISAPKDAGFEVLETWDAAENSDPETPWYRGLEGRDLSFISLPRTPLGRAITNIATRALEAVRVFPPGTTAVSTLLNHAADDLVAAGRAAIFTPLLYVKVRKPSQPAQ